MRRLRENMVKVTLPGSRWTYHHDGINIACNKFPAWIDLFIEVKVIHRVKVYYIRPGVRDNPEGSAIVDAFQGRVRGKYIARL